MKRGKSELAGWMQLAAAVLNSGYKEKDKRFLEGDCKWWHDALKEGIDEWLHDCNVERSIIA